MEKDYIYDVIIIGSGASGMTTALYTSRANLKTLVLEKELYGGAMQGTDVIENYTGFSSIKGSELSENMYKSAMQFGAEYKFREVIKLELNEKIKKIRTTKETFLAKTVVIATGSIHRKLGLDNEDEYIGRGVSYCAICDGAFFKDKEVVVIGGGDSAVEESLYLTQFAKKVTIIHRRDDFSCQNILKQRIFENEKIHILWDTIATNLRGNGQKLTNIDLFNQKNGKKTNKKTDGVFVYIGMNANTGILQDTDINLDEFNYVVTDLDMKTNLDGVFAIGDVRSKKLRQVATAVGDGAIASQSIFEYLQNN